MEFVSKRIIFLRWRKMSFFVVEEVWWKVEKVLLYHEIFTNEIDEWDIVHLDCVKYDNTRE